MSETFDDQIRGVQDRVDHLTGLLLDSSTRRDAEDVARAALAELTTALEELHVAGEELATQTEELLVSREQIERQRRYFEDLFASGPAAYVVTDPTGVITSINEPAAAILLIRPEFAEGKPLSVFLSDESRTAAFRLMRRAATTAGSGHRADLELRQRSGDTVAVTAIVAEAPTSDARDSEFRWLLDVGIDARDFESLTPAEQTIKSASLRLEAIVESASDGIISIDHDERIILYNRAAEELLGWPAAEMLGQPLSRILPHEVATRHSAFIEEFVSELGAWRPMGERPSIMILNRDGETFPAGITISNARIDDHWVQTAIIRDETLQHAADHELRRAEEFSRRVIASLDALVLVLDRDLHVVVFNAACGRVTGFRSQDVRGDDLVERLVPADERDRFRARLADLLGQGRPVAYEGDWITVTGARRRIRWTFAPLDDEATTAAHIIGTGIDVTRERELEHQVESGERFDLLGQLAGGIAHDFNNVLGIIGGHLELLLETDGLPASARSRAESIGAALRRATGLVENLTTMKLEAAPRPAPVSINAVIASFAELLGGVLGPSIDLELDLHATTDLVAIEPNRLEQVLLNLVLNARDAMLGAGRVTIATTSDRPVDGTATLHLDVTDTGEGMDDDALAQAFEPFFSTKSKGTGIGLATTALIVRAAGGAITATSSPGIGTTMHISLPAVPGHGSTVRGGP